MKEVIDPESNKIIKDYDLPIGETVVKKGPRSGYVYNIYKIVKEDSVEIDRILVNTSVYKPTQGILAIGAKEIDENN